MVEVDIPQSLFEEQGRQLYGAKLLEIQVVFKMYFYLGLRFELACTSGHGFVCISLL